MRENDYSRNSMDRAPYDNDAWETQHNGKNSRYWINLVKFTQGWLREPQAGPQDIVDFEMFPFQPRRLPGPLTPPSDLSDSMIWQPFLELEPDIAFAFGAYWVQVCDALLRSCVFAVD